jgi:chromate reductase, NAD(P)H dehydrogenase (quinone)
MNIALLVGSLRQESFNRKTAKALQALAPPALRLELLEIGQLPFYNEDAEGEGKSPPPEWTEFRRQVAARDGIVFVTPEYNRSVPGVLKNAIDVGSRPYGKSAWAGKPAAVISASPGAGGGFGANHHLRQSLVFLDMPCLQQPELYIGHADEKFDAQGSLQDGKTRELLGKFLDSYAAWVAKIRGPKL